MAFAIFVAILSAAFLVGLVLRAKRIHWFKAWLGGSAVVPLAVVVSELFAPSGWLAVALFFGTLYGIAASAVGTLIGLAIARRATTHAAS